MADKRIQIKDKDGNKIYPAIDFSLTKNIGALNGAKIEDNSVEESKISGVLSVAKGGTGASTISGARGNLDVYSKTEVDGLIAKIDQFNYEITDELPAPSANTEFIIYLTPESNVSGSYVEWLTIKVGDTYKWEQIGTTAPDLTGYSKRGHTHTFSVTTPEGKIGSGKYSKTTGVNINVDTAGTSNYTPAGEVTLTQQTGAVLNTKSINSVSTTGVLPSLKSNDKEITSFNQVGSFSAGKLPTTASVSVVSNAINGVSASFKGESGEIKLTPTGSISLNSDTISTNGVPYISGVTFNKASAIKTADVLTGVSATSTVSGLTSLTADTISTNGIPYIASISFEGVSSSKGDYTPSGKITLNTSSTSAADTISYIEGITFTGASGNSTGGFLKSINGGSGSLTADNISTNGVPFISSISHPTLTTETGDFITGLTTSSVNAITDISVSKENVISSIKTTTSTIAAVTSVSSQDFVTGIAKVTSAKAITKIAPITTNALSYATLSGTYSTTGTNINARRTLILTVNTGSLPTVGSLSITEGSFLQSIDSLSTAKGIIGTTTSNISVLTGISAPTLSVITGVSYTGSSVLYNISETTGKALMDVKLSGASSTLSYLHHTHTAASAGTSASAITSINGGGVETTVKHLNASFAGNKTNNLVTSISGGGLTGNTKYLHTITDNMIKEIGASGSVKAITEISGGEIYPETSYLHASFNGSEASSSFTPAGNISITTTSAPTVSIKQITEAGILPSLSVNEIVWDKGSPPTTKEVTVADGVKAQPSYKASFAGTGVNIQASLTQEDDKIDIMGSLNIVGTTKGDN